MAAWLYAIDNVNLNDWENFVTEALPELDNVAIHDLVLVAMAGDYPWYVRSQPREGQYTLNVTAVQPNPSGGNPAPCTPEQWAQRLVVIRSLMTPGPHVLTVQARGMTAAKSMTVMPASMATTYRIRAISLSLIAPTPVFT